MRSCKWKTSQLHLFVEGELATREILRLQRHVDECPHCSEQVQEFSRLKTDIEESLEGQIVLTDHEVVVRDSMASGVSLRRRPIRAGFFKKALAGAAIGVATVAIAAFLFVHFYFQRTFSHELSGMVIRCSRNITKSASGSDWKPLRVGERLRADTHIRTPRNKRSFLSLDGIRILTEGAIEFRANDQRSFTLDEGAFFIASARRDRPVTLSLGKNLVETNGGALRIERSGDDISIGVASGKVELTMPDGARHSLSASQSASLKQSESAIRLAYDEVTDPFLQLKIPVIERIKERFAGVVSRYGVELPGRPSMTGRIKALQLLGLWSRPDGLQFASYSPASPVRMAQRYGDRSDEYYENLFVASNRSISIGREKTIPLEPGTAAVQPKWSHDGSMIAFFAHTPYSPRDTRVLVARLNDLDHPWEVSQGYDTVIPMLPLSWAPDNRHVVFLVTDNYDPNWGWRGPYKIKIAPIDPEEGPLRDFDSPFYDIPLSLPIPVGKTISPNIAKMSWGDAMACVNWGNLAYIPVEEDGQSVWTAPGLFLTSFDPRDFFIMGGGFSPSGSKIFFTAVEDLTFNPLNIYMFYDVEDVLDGFAPPPRSLEDPRIKRIAPSENPQFSASSSYDESLVFFHEDVSNNFRTEMPTAIQHCDFDLFYDNALQDAPSAPTQIHLPGNQMFMELSPEGNRLAYCDYLDNRFEIRIVTFDVETDIDRDLGGVLIDNSGTNLIVPPGTLEDDFSVRISTPFTIEDEAEMQVGERRFFAVRLIDAGKIEKPEFIEPMTLTIRYTEDEVAGLDEGMLEVYYYDESDPDNPGWVPLGGTVDPDLNEITVDIQHFSKFSVGGKKDIDEDLPTLE